MFLELAGAGFSALAELGAGISVLALAGAGFSVRDDSDAGREEGGVAGCVSVLGGCAELGAGAGSGSTAWSALAELGASGDASRAHVMSMPFGPKLDQENSG